ncbi:FErroChelatase-Like [Caenorhabditis elegans]|uniref:FErroChelatase-Like n=1 Tax=Caenorhabditis elegans TaxID=6239 RepID=G5EBW5_CAEEL|nr:FErroChelatase-Like [Caenorhabditis elegans]CAC35821.1 FErroChelatase-Like [Caenorhabditis elegans]|eukprot:NP_492023.1 FErroChelatase-Like [Caenorhabditis elegans]
MNKMLSRNQNVIRVAARSHFSADPARSPQTEIILLHAGQPWNEFHAKEFLKNQSAQSMRLRMPNFVHTLIANGKLKNENLKGCIAAYKNVPSLESQVDRLGKKIEESLDTVVPEHGPFKVSRLFQFDEVSFEDQLKEIKSHRSQHYIFMPLYPHFSAIDSETLLVKSAKIIEQTSSPLVQGNKNITSSRIEQNSDYSYDVSAIWRWNNHPILADYWSSKIKEVLPKLDGVVFAAPRKFTCNYGPVFASCERTMNQLGDLIPWRLGFYSSWDSFDLPSMQGVASQVQKIRKTSESGKVAVVPITDVIETFNTLYTLPKKVEHLKNALVLRPDYESDHLTHGISEIVKNLLLGRKDQQLEVACSTRQLQNLNIFLH